MEASEVFEVGLPEEQQHFKERHRVFLKRHQSLITALNSAFIRKGTTAEPVDRVIFYLGRLCAEDFWEIFLLCANGYGNGAMKIVRGMYEKAVTARYLHLHPEECNDFMDFHWVQQYKLGEAIRKVHGEDALPGEQFEQVRENYKHVRERFLVPDCEKCGTKRVNHYWSTKKRGFVTMAHATDSLGKLIVPGYYLPLRQAHSTMQSILSRLEHDPGHGFNFQPGAQRDEAAHALLTAHNLILNVLELQKDHFHLDDLHELLQKCFKDFLDIWKSSEHKSGGRHPIESLRE